MNNTEFSNLTTFDEFNNVWRRSLSQGWLRTDSTRKTTIKIAALPAKATYTKGEK